jgi:hypothetical protein
MGEEKIPKLGSLYVSESAHAFLTTTVYNSEPSEDSPFTAIVEAFRFAFALGYSNGLKIKSKGTTKTVAPRQFTVTEYLDILESNIDSEYTSLGGLASAYAEAGVKLMIDWADSGKSILSILDN